LFEGSVYSVLPAGSEWYIKVKVGEEILTVTIYNDLNLTIDEPIWVGVFENTMKCFGERGTLL